MAANHIGHGMIGPHVGNVVGGEVSEFCLITLVGSAVHKAAVGQASVGTVAGKVHGEGNVTATGPMFGPAFEGFASSAMNKNDGRKGAPALLGPAEIREHA